jgi:hypothetical protein
VIDRPPTGDPRPRPGFSAGTFQSPGEGLAWLGGLVLALSSFMSWYTLPSEDITASVTAWHTGILGKLIFFIGLAVVALLVLRMTGFELPPGVPLGMVIAGLGALATVFVLVRLISIPDDFVGAGRSIGIWISLLAALLLIAAGLLKSADEASASRSP